MNVQMINIWGGFIQACRANQTGIIAIIVHAPTREGAKARAIDTALERFPLAEGWSNHHCDVTGQTVSAYLHGEKIED